MKNPIRFSVLILLISFLGLFGFRLFVGYVTYPSGGTKTEQVTGSSSTSFSYERKNYASKKPRSYGKSGKNGSGSATPLSVDQKYEKVGTVSLKSTNYESDEAGIRKSIENSAGLIQYEQSSGLSGRRSLHLAIGVIPERFDALITELKKLGTLTSIRIDKVDKTNEYKMLQARRTTFEATHKSLETLKSKEMGTIKELIELEEKISQTESEIQALGVNLGDYDAENEFCTVKCSLLESVFSTSVGISFAQRLKVAFEWTVAIYMKLIMIGLIGTLSLWATLLAYFQIRKILPTIKKWIESRVEA